MFLLHYISNKAYCNNCLKLSKHAVSFSNLHYKKYCVS